MLKQIVKNGIVVGVQEEQSERSNTMHYNHTTHAYELMVEDIKDRIGADETPEVIEDVANHSADAGWGGFTYTTECVEFYERHKDALWEMLREDSEEFGYSNPMEFVVTFNRSDMLDDEDGLKNLLAWYALETVCRRLVDEL